MTKHSNSAGGFKRAPQDTGRDFISALIKHRVLLLSIFIGLAVAVFSTLIWSRATSEIPDLVNASDESLKSALIGNPGIFLCDKGRRSNKPAEIPEVYLQLHSSLRNKYSFAVLNCSQALPSGKYIFEKYNLKKSIAPQIFAVAPWMKPVQATPSSMKSASALEEYFESAMTPKATSITSTADLVKSCGWGSNKSAEKTMCVAASLGGRYSDEDAAMIRGLIRAYPKARYVQFIAKNRKLSVDRSDESAAEKYAVKLYAMKNSTLYLPLTGAVTLETASEFIESITNLKSESKFLIAPSEIALIKVSSGRIKQQMPEKKDSRVKKEKEPKKSPGQVEEEANLDQLDDKARRSNDNEGTEDDRERARILREAEIRERMAQEERDYLFEESESVSEGADEESARDEEADTEEEIIEL
jgi:hypothetical protein